VPLTLPARPYRTLKTVEGDEFPYYIIPFDDDGWCEAPKTLEDLLDCAQDFSDIFLFSHGWNNDWSVATKRYEHFISGFQNLRADYHLPASSDYRPLLVGVFWPSQALAWFTSEVGPQMASAADLQDEEATTVSQTLREIASLLPKKHRPRFYELAQADAVDEAGAKELASMLARLTQADDEAGPERAPSAADLLAAAVSLSPVEPDFDVIGTATGSATDPDAAFGLGDVVKKLDPRNLLKPFTVWQMKDRAGTVGANGVSRLLEDLLVRSAARVHLLGHSFGCKVVMTALCKPATLSRRVESALLLQAAVSQYAFAMKVPERNVPGGFAGARERVRRPIVATFSSHDRELSSMFHLAVRRHDDLGELQFAAGGTPSRYAALGGYGPQNSDAAIVAIGHVESDYDLSGSGRVIGIDGSRTISGHGDVSNESTWWLAYSLATAHTRYPED
jgi:hypothetical protein